MKMAIRFVFVFVMLLCFVLPSSAEEFAGGLGTNWVQSGMTIPAGSMMLTSHGRAWTKDFSDAKLRNLSGVIGVHFGFTRNIELGLSQILYQDPLWADPRGVYTLSNLVPGNLDLRLKFGNVYTTWGRLYLVHSLTGGMTYNVAKINNLPYHNYFSKAMEPSVTFSTSWYSRPLFPEESEFFGMSVTYINHNENTKSIATATQTVIYSMAYTYPIRPTVSVGGQIFGLVFAKQAPKEVFSREPYAYIAPLANFKIMEGIDFLISPEILISSAKNSTNNRYDNKREKNYEAWRLTGMIKFIPPTPFYSIDPFAKTGQGRKSTAAAAVRERLARDSKQSLFDWTVNSEIDLLFLNSDLIRAQQEREKAEQELKKLENEINQKK